MHEPLKSAPGFMFSSGETNLGNFLIYTRSTVESLFRTCIKRILAACVRGGDLSERERIFYIDIRSNNRLFLSFCLGEKEIVVAFNPGRIETGANSFVARPGSLRLRHKGVNK